MAFLCLFGIADSLFVLEWLDVFSSFVFWVLLRWLLWLWSKKWGPKSRKNGPRVWAFCKIEFPGIQKPVQIFGQKSAFFKKCGNRGVGVIWLVRGVRLFGLVVVGGWLWVWLVVRFELGLLRAWCCGYYGWFGRTKVFWFCLAVKVIQVNR